MRESAGSWPDPLGRSDGQEALEERAIAFERDAEIFGRHVVAATPLLFEPCPLGREHVRQPLQHFADKRVGLLNSRARLIDESRLNSVMMPS
jgi:hypothetical protein